MRRGHKSGYVQGRTEEEEVYIQRGQKNKGRGRHGRKRRKKVEQLTTSVTEKVTVVTEKGRKGKRKVQVNLEESNQMAAAAAAIIRGCRQEKVGERYSLPHNTRLHGTSESLAPLLRSSFAILTNETAVRATGQGKKQPSSQLPLLPPVLPFSLLIHLLVHKSKRIWIG